MSEEDAAVVAAAEEEEPKEQEVDEDAEDKAENGEGADGKKKGPRNNDRKRDEKPIEELYDLTKPIPKVEKPNKAEHDKQLAELTEAFEKLKEERNKIQEQIEGGMTDADGKSALSENRAKLNALKTQKNALIEEKKAMRAQMDQAKTQNDKLQKDKNATKSNIKFETIEEIEAEILKLKRRQETVTMTLNEEKKLIKEIENLQNSKKFVADLKSKTVAMEGVREQRKTIKEQIEAKDKEIDAITKEMDVIGAALKEMSEKETSKRDAVQELFKKRDEIKKEIAAKLKEKDAIRATFRKENDAFYNYQRAVRAQKKMQYEEEKRKREEEKAARLAKIEAEEAKKIPYEEEQNLCEFLANYLERTYLKSDDEKKADDAASGKPVVEVKDSPFAGLTPANKKNVDEEYFGKGKAKKKRVRTAKKQDQAGPFTLSVDTFEQFSLIDMSPPVSIEQVEKSVKDLREKKVWYSQQPRGSVPTAAEIRKANEKAAAKLRQSSELEQENAGVPAAAAGKKKGGFSLSTEEFAPLSSGTGASSAPLNSSWGHNKPAPSADGKGDEAPTPAEAAAAAAEE